MKIFYNYHLNKYPLINKEDKIKLIYQSTLGPNHLGKNLLKENVKQRLEKELLEKNNNNDNIYEWISEEFLRINIHQLTNIEIDYLIDSFLKSSKSIPYDINILKQHLLKYLTIEELKDYNYLPISHSNIYRNTYLPHYLLINKDYLTIDLRVKQLDNFIQKTKDFTITSLEGKCTSGKTTITKQLENKYTIINIDDFFLSKEKKTPERLNEIGGNIDYELVKTCLLTIKDAWKENKQELEYKVFDCTKQEYYTKKITLKNKVILEGVYSYHPYFNNLIDCLAYIQVDKETQLNRVSNRILKDKFINEWIPLENKYFEYYKLEDICDIII